MGKIVSSSDGLFYMEDGMVQFSGGTFTEATLVYLYRLGYVWRNANEPPEDGKYLICITCLGDTRTIEDPEEVCPACRGMGRVELS